ncbi:QcrA and Rieske domain-containing protein [Flavobacterium muglaense]|uniref:Rieske (2Fe-2S) protein n=1 Tax=Flavobacterium muglaense TaxID=2764716 RepID=A0A923SIY8_9FLAO|nr:Rieske (2Fe-2S) protein [Flavobacterium muglaense]MBC5837313.1 Rieske (2Fe-2S) protein [Flavobacterium muglaense]MBC5843763.1 Rieske (2Fe-2S) protein [Flavobacterium muglaense]
MNRKEFFSRVGFGAAAALLPACVAGLATSCSSAGENTAAPTSVDFILDISTGSLATDGGFLVSNKIVVARVNASTFLAVSAACTHEGTNVNYVNSSNSFHCPNHGANFSNTGSHLNGPGSSDLKQYNVTLVGNSLRVYS